MLEPSQAKRQFRKLLALLLATIFWPLIALFISIVLAIAGLKSLAFVGVVLMLAWVGLTIWLFVAFWGVAKDVGVTPWAVFWLLVPVVGVVLVAMLFLEPLKYQADGLSADRRLPWTWDLIKETWKFYSNNFMAATKISVWYLYAYIVAGAILALVEYFSANLVPVFAYLLILPLGLFSLWVMLNLFWRMWNLDQQSDKPLEEKPKKYLSYLWITVQSIAIGAGPFVLSLAIVISVAILVGGWQNLASSIMPDIASQPGMSSMNLATFLIVGLVGLVLTVPAWLWMVYKTTIWNSLVLPVFLTQGKTGYGDLKECDRIAKGRWWGLFWKSQLAGLIFGSFSLLLSLGLSIAALLLAAVFRSLNIGSEIAGFISEALNGILQMVILPLFIAFSLKLYQAFSRTAR